MIGRLQRGERYYTVLVYTKEAKVVSYETLMLTEADIVRFRRRAVSNPEYEVDRPRPLYIVVYQWLSSWIRRAK